MASSRRSVGSQIVFHGPRAVSVRSGGSKASNSTAQVGLARRLLFPPQAPSKPLPPVLASTSQEALSRSRDPAALKALNDEIYDFLALALRGFVLPWWSKITPRDREFLPEINHIITHLVQQLETRVLVADLPSLVARTIPILITQHYVDYRVAQSKIPTSYSTGLHSNSTSLPHLFHSLQPHMAVSADGVVDANYIRQIVEHIMKTCLPPEDWQAETERNIVREIVLKIILGDVFPKLSQPWFLHKGLLDVLGPPKESVAPSALTARRAFTFNTIVIFILSAVQAISGFAIAAIAHIQSGLHIIAEVNDAPQTKRERDGRPPLEQDLASPALEMTAEILTMRERGATTAILSLVEIIVGFLTPFLNRLIPYLFYEKMHPSIFTKIIVQSKKVLFPNGYPGPPPIDPTAEEQVLLREQLERRLFDLVPPTVAKVLFGPNLDVQRRTVKGILDPLNSSKCNVHLLLFIFDAILVTVFPELALGIEGEEPESGPEDMGSPASPSFDPNGVERPLSGLSLFDASDP